MKLVKPARVAVARNVAEFIDQQIEWTEKTAYDIAEECGFAKANIISMIRYGRTKMPMNKIGKMAKALEVDPVWFLQLVMSEYDPEGWAILKEVIGRPVISANEMTWIQALRTVTSDDPQAPENAGELLKNTLVKTARGEVVA